MSSRDKLRDTILEMVEIYGERGFTAEYINRGWCGEFAEDVVTDFEGAVTCWDDSHYYHCFIYYKGLYYDSECPDGVNHPEKLPTFKRLSCFVSFAEAEALHRREHRKKRRA